MSLKANIDQILRDKNRSLSWLALNMGKTFDGLRLGLINESIKYKDMLIMAEILRVSPCTFFKTPEDDLNIQQDNIVNESTTAYGTSLKSCRELADALKDQLKDKERIILLLSKKNGIGC